MASAGFGPNITGTAFGLRLDPDALERQSDRLGRFGRRAGIYTKSQLASKRKREIPSGNLWQVRVAAIRPDLTEARMERFRKLVAKAKLTDDEAELLAASVDSKRRTVSTTKLAERFGCNQSTICRRLARIRRKIAATFPAIEYYGWDPIIWVLIEVFCWKDVSWALRLY